MRSILTPIGALCLALSLPFSAAGADAGEELIAAVQQQKVKAVHKLLEAGADVDFKTRYGATALFFACDKGNVELVELLLEHGATVDVTDTFYDATPLGWALFSAAESAAHREIVLRLLAAGASEAAAALDAGVQAGDLELAQAALETDRVTPAAIADALERAEAAGREEIAAILRPRAPAAVERPAVEVAPETLATYAGAYKNDEAGRLKVIVDGGGLRLAGPGDQRLALEATGEDTFAARGLPAGVTFSGRAGLIEGLSLRQDGRDTFYSRIEEAETEVEVDVEAAPEATSLEPLPAAPHGQAKPWPRFRGTGASGIGDGQGAPARWDGATGEGVRWKTRIPGLANSSPIVWGDRIFVTTAVTKSGDQSLRTGLYGDVASVDDTSRHVWKVLCLDKGTGEVLWQRTARRGRPKAKRHLKSTQANPTPATDGESLVVHFGSQGIYCYDTGGRRKWRRKKLGVLSSGWFFDPTYEWGFSSSPILHDGKAISQVDVHDGSYIAAYDLASGDVVWQTERDEIPTWGTPVILPAAGGAEIVTNGTTVRGYDAASGEELWRLAPNSEVTVASPVVAGGVAFITGGYPPVRPIYAVKPGGRGDLSLPAGETASEQVLWSTDRGGTYIPTPIVYRGILYVLHNSGRLTAHDAATGELIYRARVGRSASFSSSPVAADGRLYFTTEEGATWVVRAGESYQVLGINQLGEVVMSTPAISDGLMVIRGAHHVYGLGQE